MKRSRSTTMPSANVPESELLPGPKGQPMYYDGVGYYYNQTSEDHSHRWLQCSHTGCEVTAYMDLYPGAPIKPMVTGENHTHQPNPSRRERIFFLHQIKSRHSSEKIPFSVIFQEEAKKNPVGASFFSFDKIEKHLKKKITEHEAGEMVDQQQTIGRTAATKRRGRPSLVKEPEAKRRQMGKALTKPGPLSKKLQLIKSLQDISLPCVENKQDKPSERLPGPYPHSFLYYDGNGYYYRALSVSNNIRTLKCSERGCKAQATMSVEENSPISLDPHKPLHNHPPQAKEISEEEVGKKKYSERLQGPEFFHDFRGNYYYSTDVNTRERHLRCLVPTCLAEASMALEDNSEIRPVPDSRPHNHKPDLTNNYANKIKQLEGQWTECIPSERLPSLRVQYCCYHDGRGFFYHQASQADNIRYLICIEPSCPVRAQMCTQKDAPITVSPLRPPHSHPADLTLRDALLFIDAVRVRVRSDTPPVLAIELEASRNKIGAKRVDHQLLLISLQRASEITSGIKSVGITEDEVDFSSCIKAAHEIDVKSSTENQPLTPNHFSSIISVLDNHKASHNFTSQKEDSPKGPLQKSEVLPGRYKPVYHDGSGYYFLETFSTDKFRFLMCVEPKCLAQAKMELEEGSPVILLTDSQSHNHVPDMLRRACLQLMNSLRHRVRSQLTLNMNTIYKEESEKEPIVATQIPKESLLNILENIRLAEKKGIDTKISYNENDNQVEEEGLWESQIPAEHLPSHQYQGGIYHDGRGYHYYCHHVDKVNKRKFLKCCEENCGATGVLEGRLAAPVTRAVGSVLHNHTPDLQRPKLLLFLHRVVSKARSVNHPLHIVFHQEAKLDPEGASLLPKNKIRDTLHSLKIKYFKNGNAEDSEEDDLNDKMDNGESKVEPCEMLYSEDSDKPVYYNKGYYYKDYRQTANKQHLTCIITECKAHAYLLRSDPSYIHIPASSSEHSHKPDMLYRNKLVFVHNLRERVLNETTSIITIYNEEAEREPIGADIANEEAVKNLMYKLRKSKNVESINQLKDDSEEGPNDGIPGDASIKDEFDKEFEDFNDESNAENNVTGAINEYNDLEIDEGGGDEYTEEEYLDEDRPTQSQTSNNHPWNVKRTINNQQRKNRKQYRPTEKLPTRSNRVLYYNGEGYYFHFNSVKEKIMYLRCAKPRCKVRAWKTIENEDSPIIPTKDSPIHNHQPNFTLRKQLLFLHRCKLRAANENISLNRIWEAEAAKDSESASQICATNVRTQMKRYRQENATYPSIQAKTSGQSADPDSEDGITFEDASITDYIQGDEFDSFEAQDIHQGAVPERIPSLTNETLWHAAGYFYTLYKIEDSIQKCRCINKDCKARAHITGGGDIPLRIRLNKNTAHNHQADLLRRDQLLFIDQCKRRAVDSFEPIQDIYDDVAAKEPEVAAQLSAGRVKRAMVLAKKAQMGKFNYKMENTAKNSNENTWEDEMEVLSEQSEINSYQQDTSGNTSEDDGESVGPSECLLNQQDGGLVYHDGRGYFYAESGIKNGYRMLKCLDCSVLAKMALSPINAPIRHLDRTVFHSHQPDMDRMNHMDLDSKTDNSELENLVHEMKAKTGDGLHVEDEDDHYKDTDSDNQLDQRYSDYVTLEDEADSCDEEALNTHDDPDFTPSPKRTEEKTKLFHDGNGYYYTLVKDRNRRYLQCKTARCGVRVHLGPREKPLLKLFNTSPAHKHAPDQLRRKRNLFLKNASHRNDIVNELDKLKEAESKEDCNEDFIYDEENDHIDEGQPKNTKPSQMVHGRRPNTFNYHDGNGFYYNIHMVTDHFRYVTCIVNGCKARGYMPLHPDDAPINLTKQSPGHNHRPDLGYKNFTFFLEKCKMRALEEDTPIKQIYDEESALDPVSAEKILKENLIQRMMRVRSGLTGRKSAQHTQILLNPSEDQQNEQSSIVDPLGKYTLKPSDTAKDILEDLDKDIEESYSRENARDDKGRSEVLPGFRPNSTIYHDCKGYYFIFNALKENKRYLRCIEPRCRVRGSMRLYDGAPIVCSTNAVHNHRPDFKRKKFVLFLQKCKVRAMNETLPILDIYTQEAEKDPGSAALISSHNLLQRMSRARKTITKYYPTDEDQTEFVEACRSETTSTNVPAHELVDEDSHSQDDAYHNIVTEAVTDDDEAVEEDTETEAIEMAINRAVNDSSIFVSTKGCPEGAPVPEDQLKPSETLPGIRPNCVLYHDGRGYYYIYNNQRENVWYLKCLESRCRVRAHMQPQDGSPIIQSPNSMHNHRPDFKRRRLVLWMEKAKERAITENLPIPTIYAQEAAKDPVSASLVSEENVKTRMYRARKKQEFEDVNNEQLENETVVTETPVKTEQVYTEEKTDTEEVDVPIQSTHIEQEDVEESVIEREAHVNGNNHTVVMVADSQFDQVEDNEAVITIQSGGCEDNNTVYLYQSSSNVTPQRPTFCDDKGYCYQQTTIRNNTRYLKCIEKNCKTRASMSLERNAAITLSKQSSNHNHQPEQSEFAMLLDSSQLVGPENTPIQVIYTDENGGEQVTLCHITGETGLQKRPYRQRQKPDLTIDPEADVTSFAEVDVAGGDYYHNEDQQQFPLKPSEVIPGLRPDANNYHDGNGFYYELNRLSQNIRYLKCLTKDCRARAYMELGKENAPIIQTNFAKHNHGPDLFRKQFTVFLHRVTRRAAEEDTPINVIYQQEAERDPQSASQIRMENVKQRMMRFRKKHRQNINYKNITGTDADMDGSIYHFLVEDDKEVLKNASHDSYYILDDDDGETAQLEEPYEEKYIEKQENEESEDLADDTSLYQGYVVSEVEVESSSQQQQG